MVIAPGALGELGIAPRHAPLLTTLKPGDVRVQAEGQDEQVFYVGGGALEVQPKSGDGARRHGRACQGSRRGGGAGREAARRGSRCARARDKREIAEAQAELLRAVAQLRAIERLRKKR